MSTSLDAQIKSELETRNKSHQKHTLDNIQYELLRHRGMTKEQVEEFENLLKAEIKQRNNEMFISSEWVKQRMLGKHPDQIGYDMCHAVR